jgi:hypothetical protein
VAPSQVPISPNTDTSDNEFATPPTTSKGLSRVASPADPESEQHAPSSTFTDLNGAASQFAPVEVDFASRFPEAEIIEGDDGADVILKGKVSEIEREETDSSSDEDEEGVPLAQLALKKKKSAQEQAAPSKVPCPTRHLRLSYILTLRFPIRATPRTTFLLRRTRYTSNTAHLMETPSLDKPSCTPYLTSRTRHTPLFLSWGTPLRSGHAADTMRLSVSINTLGLIATRPMEPSII